MWKFSQRSKYDNLLARFGGFVNKWYVARIQGLLDMRIQSEPFTLVRIWKGFVCKLDEVPGQVKLRPKEVKKSDLTSFAGSW